MRSQPNVFMTALQSMPCQRSVKMLALPDVHREKSECKCEPEHEQ